MHKMGESMQGLAVSSKILVKLGKILVKLSTRPHRLLNRRQSLVLLYIMFIITKLFNVEHCHQKKKKKRCKKKKKTRAHTRAHIIVSL